MPGISEESKGKDKNTRLAVVGAGVIGLTTAIKLLEDGFHNVTVIADRFTPSTTSDIACAWWFPAVEGFVNPLEIYKRQSLYTLNMLYKMAEENKGEEGTPQDNGVRIRSGKRFFEYPVGDVWFAEHAKDFRILDKSEIPVECGGGLELSSAFADMSVFMVWLNNRFDSLGGKRVARKLERVTDARQYGEVIFNCSGLGARFLEDVKDPSVYPLRGQIALVHHPEIEEFIGADVGRTRTYVLPRTNGYVVCGGTSHANEFGTEPCPETAKAILERCSLLQPKIREARIVKHVCGLRPSRRGGQRVQLELIEGVPVIHNYGHGGSGLTLCFGSAVDACSLLGAAISLTNPHLRSKL